jgi:hypothetical protein
MKDQSSEDFSSNIHTTTIELTYAKVESHPA